MLSTAADLYWLAELKHTMISKQVHQGQSAYVAMQIPEFTAIDSAVKSQSERLNRYLVVTRNGLATIVT